MSGRILLIDDDLALAKTLQMPLRTRGWDVDVAHTGADGIAAASTSQPPYALAIVDLRLPDCDGYEVVTRFQQAGLPTPLAMVSGYGAGELMADPRSANAVAFYSKPIPLDDLCALLDALASKQSDA